MARLSPQFPRALLGLAALVTVLFDPWWPVRPCLAESSPTNGTDGHGGGGSLAAEEPYYFYHGLDYGSESLIHPLRLIINGGFGIMQIESRDNRPFDVHYATGWRNVTRNLRDPISAIESIGWWTFLKREIIPISIDSDNVQYWPNYSQHLIGGGVSYRLMTEWYRYHEFGHPQLWSLGTITVYHLLNEVVENNGREGYNVDPIADLYLFDPASIWLFSSEKVCRFFSETLHFTDWSYQPVYDPQRRTLENNGQNFALKLNLRRQGRSRWSLFYHYGTHGEIGLSYTKPNGDCWSFGAGLMASNLRKIDNVSETAELAVSAGIFYDRNNSLLASLLAARTKDYRLRLNLYPGLFNIWGVAPGFFLSVDKDDHLLGGVSIASLPVGYGVRF